MTHLNRHTNAHTHTQSFTATSTEQNWSEVAEKIQTEENTQN